MHQISETLPGDDYMRIMTYIDSINGDFVKSWSNRYERNIAKLFSFCLLEKEPLHWVTSKSGDLLTVSLAT